MTVQMTDRVGTLEAVVGHNAADYHKAQQERIRMDARLLAVDQGRMVARPETVERWRRHRDLYAGLEKEVEQSMKDDLDIHPLWPWLKKVRGIGPVMATKMIGEIEDISTYDKVSQLWCVAGLAVDQEGKADRPKAGHKLRYHKSFKVLMFNIGKQMMLAAGKGDDQQYVVYYYNAKHRYKTMRKSWTDQRRHFAALRYMNKIFLSHVWAVWRAALGLRTRPLYVEEYDLDNYHFTIFPWDVIPDYEYPHGIWRGED